MEKIDKTVLAFDTALGGISVGVITKDGRQAQRVVETQRDQAALLVPLIQETLADAKTNFKELDLIICTRGPGSFTGLRIGLSTARMLGITLGIPVLGVGTLDLMARHYDTVGTLLILLETKRKDFYANYFDTDKIQKMEPFAADAETIISYGPSEPFSVGGDCVNRFRDSVSGEFNLLENITQPDPIIMAQYGLAEFERGGDQGMPQPLYLRGADVSQPKTPPRKLQGSR